MKKNLFKFIENSERAAVELETLLTAIPALSPDSGGTGELRAVEALEQFLRSHGITNLERIDVPDERAEGGIRPNLIATIEGRDEKAARLWLMSHIDVVPPGDIKLWNSDPWKLVEKDGKIYGRGVEDNRQGLVSSVLAALAFVENKIVPERTVKLLFVADEETANNYGIDALIKRGGLFRPGDMAVVPDGGDGEGATIEIAEKNLGWYKFTVNGKQSHGSRPDEGINAHLAAAALILRLYDGLHKKFDARDDLFEPPYSTFEPTKKESNIPNINTIPPEDIFYFDTRVLPCYKNAAVSEEINRIALSIENEYKVNVGFERVQGVESRATSKDAPIVGLLSSAVNEVLGVTPRPIGIGGGTVGAYLRNAGIDAAVWSKLDDTAHHPNEYAVISNILDGAKVMAVLAL